MKKKQTRTDSERPLDEDQPNPRTRYRRDLADPTTNGLGETRKNKTSKRAASDSRKQSKAIEVLSRYAAAQEPKEAKGADGRRGRRERNRVGRSGKRKEDTARAGEDMRCDDVMM